MYLFLVSREPIDPHTLVKGLVAAAGAILLDAQGREVTVKFFRDVADAIERDGDAVPGG